MAQEKLEQAAERMGVEIKVETQGGVGTENKLTTEEIKAADGIIIAADRQVDLSSGLCIPSLTLSLTKYFPSNLVRSTWRSAAMIIPSAALISSVVNLFSVPTPPCVSTLISTPCYSV